MEYKGHTQGSIVILAKPLPVPDGTGVEILIPSRPRSRMRKVGKRQSVAAETFNLIPSDPAPVRKVLLEDLYEA